MALQGRKRSRTSAPIFASLPDHKARRQGKFRDRRQLDEGPGLRSEQHRCDVHQQLIDECGLHQRSGESRPGLHVQLVHFELSEASENPPQVKPPIGITGHSLDASSMCLERRASSRVLGAAKNEDAGGLEQARLRRGAQSGVENDP